MPSSHYDVITIGAGGGAYPAAFRLARAGLRVLMTDPRGVMSGSCLAEGCVPSKVVREIAAHRKRQERFAGYGVRGATHLDYAQIVVHKDAVQNTRYAQHDKELAATALVTLKKGRARFVDAHTIALDTDQESERLSADHIIVASGDEIVMPPIPGSELCLTSHDLYARDPTLKRLPASMVVIGGGYIGLEVATTFAALGTSVTILQRDKQVLSGMDVAMVETLVPLIDPALRIVTAADVVRIESLPSGRAVHYRTNHMIERIEADVVLMAIGRKPVIPEGFAALGLPFGTKGITVNAAMQTEAPHIYACGDVNGRVSLFHAAVRQSLIAAHNILNGDIPCDSMDFGAIPATVFTLPAASFVGLSQASGAALGVALIETAYNFREDSRAQIFGETAGGIHLFFEPGNLRLRGGWVVGIDAANLIGEIGQAVANGLTAHQLARFPDQHPMASEGIGQAARALF
ncbi:MAG: dihydrolipoyl dehydrogenase [Acidiferrobacter sp.]